MRIAFFGLPLAALMLAHEGHEIALAALCRKSLPGTRRLRRALGGERVLVKPAIDLAFVARLRAIKPELIVSWFWTGKLPMAVMECAPRGGVGVHPSLLPRWRGPDPYFWAIDAGDEATGVTAHRLEAEYDTGAILGSTRVAIDRSWNAWTLARALDRPSLALLRDVVGRMARGDAIDGAAQDEAQATDAPEPDDALLAIDWSMTAAAIVRRVRAAAPYPGAWTFVGDEALVITRAEVAERVPALVAGEAAVLRGRAVVMAADAGVALLEGRIISDDEEEEAEDADRFHDHERLLARTERRVGEAEIAALLARA